MESDGNAAVVASTVAATAPTTKTSEQAERGNEVGSVHNQGLDALSSSSAGVHGHGDVTLFLSSPEGQRAYHMWSRGVLKSRRVQEIYGRQTLDAFETHWVASKTF